MAAHVSDAAHLSQQQQQVVQHHPRRIQLSMPTPHFVVTGFGQFAGVTANPTQALVEWLHKEKLCPGVGTQAAQHSTAVQSPRSTPTSTKLEDGYKISSCTVLEVSADAVCQYLQQQATLLQEACSSSEQQPVVLLHLGVDTQRNGLNLESQAYNNATFRCPDQAGWQPSGVVIEQGEGLSLNSIRTTALPVQQLAQELHDAGCDCHVSQDAGRFVCNYIYHKSLQLTESLHQSQLSAQDAAADPATRQQANSSGSSSSYCTEGLGNAAAGGGASACSSDNGNTSSSNSSTTDGIAAAATADACQGKQVYSLFVHVPPFASISEEKQREFLLVLLQAISRWLSTGDQQVGASLPVTSS